MLAARSTKPKISFLAFFVIWARRRNWEIPDFHVEVCAWLQEFWLSGESEGLLQLPRGHAKSSILGVFNAWIYYCWPELRILHQGESDKTAYKTSRDTKSVLRRHPLSEAMGNNCRGEVEFWWTPFNEDERNPSMQAAGVLSNITSSRADFIQNDDTEVQKNIRTPELRESLRIRLSEQIHIAVPGAPTLWVGTPHTHDSIYDEVKARGAMTFIRKMFTKEHRIEKATNSTYHLDFVPEVVFEGIGKHARLLKEGQDYRIKKGAIELFKPNGQLIDFYAGALWPQRFTMEEMESRRRKTKTINEWDSQYQLHSKPITEVRLDPENIEPYEVEPVFKMANRKPTMWLGGVQIVGMAMRWDPSGGKLNSDVSAVALVLQDLMGRRYWHRAAALSGPVVTHAEDGKTITGGQVWQLCDLIDEFNVPRLTVETNGIGTFAPAIMRAALAQRGLRCAIVEIDSTANKNKRILEAFEPLIASKMLWAHMSVLDGDVWDQMRDWNPAIAKQPDDYLDAGAGAITDTPERLQQIGQISPSNGRHDWRPGAGVHEIKVEY